MKTKKKRIAQEIQSRILTIVIAIFMVVRLWSQLWLEMSA